MASVFYSVPETFRGRFRTDTSRRPYPIPQVPTPAPALPVRTDTLPIRRLDTQPPKPPDSRQHTLPNRLLSDISPSQTAGTPHTPKAKPPVFRQTLHPSDCSPFIHFPAPTPRFPGGIHVPPESPNAKTPQPSRHCPASQTGSVPFPLQTIGASPPHTRYGKRTSRTRKDRPLIAGYSSVISGQQPTANRAARPNAPISPLLYSAGPISRTLHTPTDSRPNRHSPCLSPTADARIPLLFPAAIIVAVCFIS